MQNASPMYGAARKVQAESEMPESLSGQLAEVDQSRGHWSPERRER